MKKLTVIAGITALVILPPSEGTTQYNPLSGSDVLKRVKGTPQGRIGHITSPFPERVVVVWDQNDNPMGLMVSSYNGSKGCGRVIYATLQGDAVWFSDVECIGPKPFRQRLANWILGNPPWSHLSRPFTPLSWEDEHALFGRTYKPYTR
jgi:hypothetical protein